METNRYIRIAGAPAIPGLAFRHFRGPQDYPAILAVIQGSKEADGIDRTDSLDDVANNYQHLVNCDPAQDLVFAEIAWQVVGYTRVFWQQELDGPRRYMHINFLLPAWREMGIRLSLLRQSEQRLAQIAADQDVDCPRLLEAWAADTETDWTRLLIGQGYQAVRYGFEMVRPDLEDIPDLPLPDGLEVRQARLTDVPQIWAAAKEAFRDHWGYSEDEWDQELAQYQASPTFQPELWQVAWDGDEVAGMVMNFIDRAQNEEYGRLRGYTEGICVRRPYRRQGLAKALIARSFRVHKAQGMAEAALAVDADNPNGALQLYKSMGFRQVKCHTTYRKPLA